MKFWVDEEAAREEMVKRGRPEKLFSLFGRFGSSLDTPNFVFYFASILFFYLFSLFLNPPQSGNWGKEVFGREKNVV